MANILRSLWGICDICDKGVIVENVDSRRISACSGRYSEFNMSINLQDKALFSGEAERYIRM